MKCPGPTLIMNKVADLMFLRAPKPHNAAFVSQFPPGNMVEMVFVVERRDKLIAMFCTSIWKAFISGEF